MQIWDFFIDTGGTFTDCLGKEVGKKEIREKVLSRGSLTAKVVEQLSDFEIKLGNESDWPNNFPSGFKIFLTEIDQTALKVESWNVETKILRFSEALRKSEITGETIELFSGWEAPILGMRLILARMMQKQSDCQIRMRLATTRCTNALLEDTGQKPVLFLTQGFPDLMEIGDQRRVNLFDLIPRKRKSFAGPCVEVEERTDRSGKVIQEPNLSTLIPKARELVREGHKVAVISFLNSFINQGNERFVANSLKKIGFQTVITSAEIHPFMNWLGRSESSVLEGYLYPILQQYIGNIVSGLGELGELLIMKSSGGLLNRNHYRAIDSLLSGPAGGVVGACAVAKRAGLNHFINLDMGGTSTDVSRFSGSFSYQSIQNVGDAKLVGVSMEIETVAAGGGSICRVENGRLIVGPESAGAYPGPACYGFGGPLCLTDINLILDRLDSNRFSTPLSVEAAREKLMECVESSGYLERELMAGFIAIADETMASAIRKISVKQGYDPAKHALVSFGGAGGQHICGVAKKLGVSRLLSPRDSGLLSAYGLSMSRIERVIEKPIYRPLSQIEFIDFEDELIQQGYKLLSGFSGQADVEIKTAFVRMKGQESGLEVEYKEGIEIREIYENKFEDIFGYLPARNKVEIYGLRILLAFPSPDFGQEKFTSKDIRSARFREKKVICRDDLEHGEFVFGPCLVVDDFGALWIERGWKGIKGDLGSIMVEEISTGSDSDNELTVERELFTSRFFCLVEEMGVQLKRTAISVNVRERLDFSCALLDSEGYLVANAPHIPVHLGALGLCVRESIKLFPHLQLGDIIITNHPAYGGSHLPDITVIAPIFSDTNQIIGFLANRAHHAEIGGILPGSMPAGSKNLLEEGVVISPRYLFRAGHSCMNEIAVLLSDSEFPSRQIKDNLADLSAQVASLRQGLKEMKILESEYTCDTLIVQMKNLHFDASTICEKFLCEWGNGFLSSTQCLDDGEELKLDLQIKDGHATFDFSGTASFRKDNLNATVAITQSAVCYCLRVLINKEIPLNEGLLKPVSIIIPQGSILSPTFSRIPCQCPGVAGGNVEVSQKLVDLILGAFDRVACSQGTMNNITFGNKSFSHYETVGGGSGAMIGSSGTSAVQVHMTNTAITDPEILESRFPVRLVGFKIRKFSGGRGSWNGGDGIERIYIFEEKSNLSLLTQNRKCKPHGMDGGFSGQSGEQFVIRQDGKRDNMKSVDSTIMNPGDRLILRTPGGGGAGFPDLLA
ncbi:MAG: 5-oxoprolinase [Opitutae bacterium]|nr:5-oxoprolinase [Opitutae bacterium]